MTWPTGSVVTTDVDASTDSPANARDDILSALQKLNEIIANGSPVLLAGNQSVGGVKTFTSSPVVPTPSASGHATTKTYVDDLIASVIAALTFPVGAVMSFARYTVPSGWLACDGSAVSRATYASLWWAIGTTYGAGDGSTTFNLPDLRGEFVRGWDFGRGVDSGRIFGTFQGDDFRSHTHQIWGDSRSNFDGGGRVPTVGNVGLEAWVQTEASGGVETRPRNIALLYCIKT